MYAVEKVFLSLPLFRYDQSIWKTSLRVMHDYKRGHGHHSQWNDDALSPHLLQEYADVIHAKGVPLENCFGYIDGTVRPIARPDQHQRIVYNGHKRVHLLKFQSVALPNGLIGNMFGPVGMFVTYNTYIYCYYRDLSPDFYDRAGYFLVEIGYVLPSFLFLFFFF